MAFCFGKSKQRAKVANIAELIIVKLSTPLVQLFSRTSRMLRGATQPVRIPCVCVSVCGNFFSNQPPPTSLKIGSVDSEIIGLQEIIKKDIGKIYSPVGMHAKQAKNAYEQLETLV